MPRPKIPLTLLPLSGEKISRSGTLYFSDYYMTGNMFGSIGWTAISDERGCALTTAAAKGPLPGAD